VECMIAKPSEGVAGKTGYWRTFKPVYIEEKCKGCLMCWLYCPESAIDVIDHDNSSKIKINYDYCKGCGICAKICRINAIIMEVEQ